MGIALLTKPLAIHVSSPEIAIIDINPSLSTEINLCHVKDRKLSDAAKQFIECVSS